MSHPLAPKPSPRRGGRRERAAWMCASVALLLSCRGSQPAVTADPPAGERALDACHSISDVEQRARCVAEVALRRDDLRLCDLSDLDVRDACYAAFALKRRAPALCDRIDDVTRRNRCYADVAVATADAAACNRIDDDTVRGACIDAVEASRHSRD